MKYRFVNSSYFYLAAGLFLTILGYPYFLFLGVSGLYFFDIGMTYVPFALPIWVVPTAFGCLLLFHFLKKFRRIDEQLSSPSSIFLLAYVTPLLLIGFIFGLQDPLSFFFNYMAAASACFVTFAISFFWKRFKDIQNQHATEVVPKNWRSALLQFLLMATVFTAIGVLLAGFWQWRGVEIGKMRPLFAFGSGRTIWTQLPI